MVKVTVKVDYKGKSYQTNVLTEPNANQAQILQKALDQVQKQWSE
ncbi:BA3454 family stress response protein [Peribacillus sp. SI8-4]|nr:BA3454 family stress response protein [Peribacillus sp. SI8-4]